VRVFNKHFFGQLWQQAWSLVLIEMSRQEIGWLVRPGGHLSLLSRRRTTMIVSRVRLVAALFALLTPLWIVVDVVAFTSEIWFELVLGRLAATAAFVAVMLMPRKMQSPHDAYRSLGLLLAIPTAFFIFSSQHMGQFEMQGMQAAFATGYAFLPFVVVAGLSIFPLTLIESILFAAPVLLAQIGAAVFKLPILNWPTVAASFWLLLLIMGVSALAGISQLAFMIVLVREAIRDGLTGCYSRHSGEELLEVHFSLAVRNKTPLTLAFIDLDRFKQINDTFGHDVGDHVLIDAVTLIRKHLRTGDILARWGGEEFVLVMPNASLKEASIALNRLRDMGLGRRPDGVAVTASIGVAGRIEDARESWQDLVALADSRMYAGKQAGRDRIVSRGSGE